MANYRLLLSILVVFCFAIKPLLAKTEKDSLLFVYTSGNADASTYNELIWKYVFSQPDSAVFFAQRGLDWIEKTEDDSLLASIQNRLGVAYDIKSIPDSALFFYNAALNQARATGNKKTEGGSLNNIGLVYWNLGEPEKAIDHYIQSAEIFDEIGNEIGLGNTYNNIGIILFEDKQYKKALNYYRKALTVRKKSNHTFGLAASYTNLGQFYTYEDEENLDSAMYYIRLSIPLKKQLNDKYGLSKSYHNVAEIFAAHEQADSSLLYFNKTLRLQLELENSEGYASTYYNIADVYLGIDKPQLQLAYLDSSQRIAEANNDAALLWKVYYEKAKALGRLKRFKEAHPYWISFKAIKDSLVSSEKSAKVEELETRYRTAEQEREIANKKAALAEAKLKVENRTKWIIGLLGGLIAVLFLAIAVFQGYKRRSQAEKDAAIIEEREKGLRAMIDATEEERKRIAKDLHDGIVQTLTGLSLRLQKQFGKLELEKQEQEEFQESQTMLDQSIAEVRTISHQMMPRVLAEMGLIPAIDDMLNKSLGNTEIKFEFEHHKVERERFAENIEVSLYRITQELINNIIKHSEAKAVSIQLLKTKSHLVLVVEDNGKGFTFGSEENQNGIGLMNIQSRAKAIHGEVNYQPSPEQGTVATIRIPL